MDDQTHLESTWSQRIAEMERRIRDLEFRFNVPAGTIDIFERQLEAAKNSIEWLEAKALRAEDRPVVPVLFLSEQEVAEKHATVIKEYDRGMLQIRTIDELEQRFDALQQKVAVLDTRKRLAADMLKNMLPRLDALEEKCLRVSERDLTPVGRRNIMPSSLPTVPGRHVGQT